jgi:hypothetical protein
MINRSNNILSTYRTDEMPFGKSWEEWTTEWWRWFLSTPKENHPVYDETGEKSGVNQTDQNVWFLAGTTGGRAERAINIPAGKAILLPIINVTTSYSENPELKTEEELTSFVDGHMKDIARKEATIDGEKLIISEDHRIRSPPFEFSFPSSNVFGAQESVTKGVGDGYWLFLKPLTPGTHSIKTVGACMSGRVQISVDIKLIVE